MTMYSHVAGLRKGGKVSHEAGEGGKGQALKASWTIVRNCISDLRATRSHWGVVIRERWDRIKSFHKIVLAAM